MKTAAQIQKDILEELRFDPRINEGEIGVSVHNGVVTLSGSIPRFAEKWAAEEAALKVAGVTTVVNNLHVKSVLAKQDDQDIAEAINKSITWNAWLPQGRIKALVEDGWVTLHGHLAHNYQKEYAYNAAKYVRGVRGVTNNIVVEPIATVTDIKSQIRKAIHRYADEDADLINVAVSNGEVRLSGKVHTREERTTAETAAWHTPGVSSVRNYIHIAL